MYFPPTDTTHLIHSCGPYTLILKSFRRQLTVCLSPLYYSQLTGNSQQAAEFCRHPGCGPLLPLAFPFREGLSCYLWRSACQCTSSAVFYPFNQVSSSDEASFSFPVSKIIRLSLHASNLPHAIMWIKIECVLRWSVSSLLTLRL